MKPLAIIVDLDGTLCDSSGRAHFVTKDKKDWEAFYAACVNDKPNRWCHLLLAATETTLHTIFVTGRPEKYRVHTERWLSEYHVSQNELFMREDGNFEPDFKLKERIYRDHIEPKYDVVFCLDDRKQVVDMWRRVGLVCLQCDEGDF